MDGEKNCFARGKLIIAEEQAEVKREVGGCNFHAFIFPAMP